MSKSGAGNLRRSVDLIVLTFIGWLPSSAPSKTMTFVAVSLHLPPIVSKMPAERMWRDCVAGNRDLCAAVAKPVQRYGWTETVFREICPRLGARIRAARQE